MPRKVLILTVGGSDEPVVTSITKNKPDFVYFLCSDDFSDSPRSSSYLTVEGEGKPCGSVQKCASCGATKGERRESIVKQLGLVPGSYKVIRINHFDNVNICYLEACRIIQEEREKEPHVGIIADFTGGTKSMTAGLASAAMDDGRAMLCVVSGKRLNLQKVEDGTQIARIIDNSRIMVEKKLLLLNKLWQGYHYQSCLSVLDEIYDRPLADDLYDRLEKIRYLCSAFEAWDRFDHEKALSFFKINKKIVPEKYLKFLGRIIQSKTIWAELLEQNEEKNEKAETGERIKRLHAPLSGKRHFLNFDPVYDLVLNARRRAAQGRYDDAVARLYRALEMFGQLNLLRWEHPLRTSNLDTAKLPDFLRDEYESRRDPNKGTINLGLIQNYTLLSRLETPVGKVFESYKNAMQLHLLKRNNSLMAHGITPVDEISYREMLGFVEEFLNICCRELKEKSRLDYALQFDDSLFGL